MTIKDIHHKRWNAIKRYVDLPRVDGRTKFTRRQQINIKKLYDELKHFLDTPDIYTLHDKRNKTLADLSHIKDKRIKKTFVNNPAQLPVSTKNGRAKIGDRYVLFIPVDMEALAQMDYDSGLEFLLEYLGERVDESIPGQVMTIAIQSRLFSESSPEIEVIAKQLLTFIHFKAYKEEDAPSRMVPLVPGIYVHEFDNQSSLVEYLERK